MSRQGRRCRPVGPAAYQRISALKFDAPGPFKHHRPGRQPDSPLTAGAAPGWRCVVRDVLHGGTQGYIQSLTEPLAKGEPQATLDRLVPLDDKIRGWARYVEVDGQKYTSAETAFSYKDIGQ
jgi:hypothetical protein